MSGIVFIAIGIICLYFNRKRKFERMNSFGVERFPSFFVKFKATLGDWILLVASIFCALTGLLILATENYDGWGGWVLALVYGWLMIGYWPAKGTRE